MADQRHFTVTINLLYRDWFLQTSVSLMETEICILKMYKEGYCQDILSDVCILFLFYWKDNSFTLSDVLSTILGEWNLETFLHEILL